MSTIDDENQQFAVVVNGEGQYSIWPTFKAVPEGWEETGFVGVKKYCLEHIATVWTDMRPLSLQRRMAS
jgi:MbtH protein